MLGVIRKKSATIQGIVSVPYRSDIPRGLPLVSVLTMPYTFLVSLRSTIPVLVNYSLRQNIFPGKPARGPAFLQCRYY